MRDGLLRSPALLLAAAAPLLLSPLACGGGEAGGAAGGGEAASRSSAADTPAPDRGTEGPDRADSAAGGAVPEVDERPLRAFRFRIRNGGGDTVVIVADAGAGTRTLDTLPPADSSSVRVETRASLLELVARLRSGREVARSRYELERPPGDTLLEFDAAAGAADSAGR